MKIKRSVGSRVFDVCNVIFFILLCFIMLYPLYYIAIVSISDGQAVLTGNISFLPVNVTFSSYQLVFQEQDIFISYRNTIFYTVAGTLINLAMTVLCAYPLAQPNLPGKKFVMKFVVFTMFFSGGMIPLYLVIKQLNILNTVWSMLLPSAISTFNMIVMRTFFMGLPHSLWESANLDGANEFQILWKIILPLSKPIIATMVLFYAVGHWNAYFDAMLYLSKKQLYPLQIILRNLVISGQIDSATTASGGGGDFLAIDTTVKYATVMVATVPILLVYPFVQKYFVKGVMVGSLKG